MGASVALPAGNSLVALPDWVAEKMQMNAIADEQLGRAEWLNRELRNKDPLLSLVWIHEKAPEGGGIIPGRFHVKRSNPAGVDTYMPLAGPDGEYREPGSWVLAELDKRDLWKGEVARDLFDQSRKRLEAEEKATALKAEQRRDVIAEDIRAAKRVYGDGGLTKRRMGAK